MEQDDKEKLVDSIGSELKDMRSFVYKIKKHTFRL